MHIEQRTWNTQSGWSGPAGLATRARLVLLFGGTRALDDASWYDELRASYPEAELFGCSTAGEICDIRVYDDSLVATAVAFEATPIKSAFVDLASVDGDSERAGRALGEALDHDGLVHVFTLSDGQQVNGSQLVRGLRGALPSSVQLTGGLAGDGDRFERTLVFADQRPREGAVSVLGFYGDRLKVGFGSLGGWDPFGPERTVTRSADNVLYELDGKPALELYKTYLGEHADGLPATGLLFPLNVRREAGDDALVRTILAVDEADQSLTFAGDVPEGAVAQLMKANFERLIDGAAGAAGAAQSCHDVLGGAAPELAVLISCVGRKLVLKQRTEEEVEGVREVLGGSTSLTGFYSYGEICPAAPSADCQLHNQTMTITTFRED
jgi:hypothetical protein